MIQKHRINTNIGRDQRVNVEINQNFDIMEILSLKFSQKDVFASGSCSEYGVVVGRVSANNGYGVPNAKVSIFIPQDVMDSDDPVISKLYPYQEISNVDENGYRYNLLPERQQHSGHVPTGTFPDQLDILTREEVLEVYESYYKYTIKTNSAGDFMIWGVPIGVQTIHIDLDLSDIGCFSLRPYDFLKKGYGPEDFERFYSFKSSTDIDGLPQIVTFDRSIEVYPLWGNEDLCEIGISRTDFDLSDKGINIEPVSLVLLSSVTDDSSDAVKRNGKIRKNTGYKCNLQTTGGEIECVRQTGQSVYSSDGTTMYPELEFFNVSEVIDSNGVAMAVIPMNLDYVYTNVFGEEEITNDPNKGIPTSSISRFRFSLDFESSKIATAKYLVPNIREFNPNSSGVHNKNEYSEAMVASYIFSNVFEDYISPTTPDALTLNSTGYGQSVKDHKKDLMLGENNNLIPEDYFYKFVYGKVYTVSSFQGTHYETARRDAFLGIKQIRPSEDEDCASIANYFPTNFGFKNRTKFSLLLAQVILFVQFVFGVILIKFAEILGRFLWNVGVSLSNIGIRRWRPFKKIAERFKDMAYRMQDRFTKILPLTIYPDCEECTTDDDAYTTDSSYVDNFCRVGELRMSLILGGQTPGGSAGYVYAWAPVSSTSAWKGLATDLSWLGDGNDRFNGLFPGEPARDEDGQCSGTTSLTFWDLQNIYTGTTAPNPPDTRDEKYVAQMYSYRQDFYAGTIGQGTTNFSESNLFMNDESIPTDLPPDVQIQRGTPLAGIDALWFRKSYEDWNELTGMQIEGDVETWMSYGQPGYGLLANVLRIYDRSVEKYPAASGSTLNIETGCDKYDKMYNENIAYGYLWSSGLTYGSYVIPWDPCCAPESTENIASYYDSPGFREFLPATTSPPAPYSDLMSTLIGRVSTGRLPSRVVFEKLGTQIYDRKTKTGLSEFRDGVFTIIPVIRGTSFSVTTLQEWYRRKKIGLTFCGGVVNYGFIDNWLHGLLYFFKFDNRLRWDNEANYDLNQRGSKYPRELVFYNVLDKEFYYRSCPYYDEDFVGQTFDGVQEILHPTTFYDVGVRDEFLSEICLDPRVDPNCSVVRDLSSTSYQDPAAVVEHAINYRLDINDGEFEVDDFFSGTNYGSNIEVFDGDVTQLMSINCEAGIEAFDLDTPHYFMYNGELMDPEDPAFASYFKGGGYNFGPTPIDFKFDYNGAFIRSCLNYRLGDNSQVVPFYLWDKGAEGFGGYTQSTSDDQKWDKTQIAHIKLQRLYSVSGTTAYDLGTSTTPGHSNYLMANGEEEYLLKPMTIDHGTFWFYGDYEDSLERFEVISYSAPTTTPGYAQDTGYIEGDLWLKVVSGSLSDPQSGVLYVVVDSTWTIQSGTNYFDGVYETFLPQTILNYADEKQVLSTPFLFYFGLAPGNTAIDVLTKYFGPKGAFGTTDEISCPTFGVSPTPSTTPAPSLTALPTPPPSGGFVTPTPTPTVTPTHTPPVSPTPSPMRKQFGINESPESTSDLACAIGTPDISVWLTIGNTVPTPGLYFYYTPTGTPGYVGDGSSYYMIYDNGTKYACVISGTGLIITVVAC